MLNDICSWIDEVIMINLARFQMLIQTTEYILQLRQLLNCNATGTVYYDWQRRMVGDYLVVSTFGRHKSYLLAWNICLDVT